MDKILRLMTYVDGGDNDIPFPSSEDPIEITSFTYDAKRMGGAPTITATKMYRACLDDKWTYNVYATYKEEKYFLKRIPTSSYSNTDTRYKYEIELISERVILDNVYFYDVVTEGVENDKYVSNSSSVTFFGDIQEFAKRLNYSLSYSKVGYTVVVDKGISSEPKLMSFENQYFSNVLQEIFNVYEIPYYFEGKTIHIGFTSNAIAETFKYGINNALLSITKNNANNKVINRITGVGSGDNIPYYYPNLSESGTVELITSDGVTASISNTNKFDRNARLSNKFECKQGSVVVPYSDMFQAWEDSIDLTFNKQIVCITYDLLDLFQANTAVAFTYSLDYDNVKSITVKTIRQGTGWEISNTLTSEFQNESGTFTIPENGKLLLEFSLSQQIADAPRIFAEKFIFKCGNVDSKVWFLDNVEVDLKDYGISVTQAAINGTIGYRQVKRIPPQAKLMPSIYRKEGNERFYNALNETYISPQTGKYYEFNNPYIDGKPKEHTIEFSDIKPTIKGIKNASNQFIDRFLEFEYDTNDNDETDEEGNYLHPYFFAKLAKFDGEYGFNLFDHSIEEDEMVISMTSGSCGACEFVIGVDSNTQKNLVQVDDRGNLLRDDNGNVRCGREGMPAERPQNEQNDTYNNEVWIALKKDINTFGVVMPNATNKYKPSVNDTFVILHIDLPQAYIEAAEKRLDEELIKYMAMNNDEKFQFSVAFSRIYFAKNSEMLKLLDENARIQIEYNDKLHKLYVSSYSYKMDANQPLPEIKVELSDTLTIGQNPIDNAISEVKHDIMSSVGSNDWLKLGLAYFLRKDTDDIAHGNMTFEKNVTIGDTLKSKNFHKGTITGGGWGIYEEGNSTVIEVDKVIARKTLTLNELIINQISFTQGDTVFSCGGCEITNVMEYEDYYRCYFDDKNHVRLSGFKVGDGVRCQTYDAEYNELTRYYWRKAVAVSGNYVDLSKVDGEYDADSVPPEVGDNIVQFGHEDDVTRQNAIVIGAGSTPRIYQYSGITLFNIPAPETKIEPNNNQFSGIVNFKSGSTGAENIADLPQEIQGYVNGLEFGKANLLRNTSFTGDYLSRQLDDSSALGGDSEMFSPSLEHWTVTDGNPTVVEREEAVSGFGLRLLKDEAVQQTLLDKILPNESYVLSYNLDGYEPTFSIGGYTHTDVSPNATTGKIVVVFKAVSNENVFELRQESEGCTISNIQLERGTIPSTYGRSVYDNESSLAYYNRLKYVSDAIENGQTDIYGGLILSSLIQLGKWSNNGTSFQNASGMSGYYNDDDDVAFWAGGDYDKAIVTVAKYAANPLYVPSEEELKTLAKYVVTHGGRVIMQDAIVRGTVYADSGRFKGRVEADSGVFNGTVYADSGHFKGTIDAQGGTFKGRVEAEEGYFKGELNIGKGANTILPNGSGKLGNGSVSWNVEGEATFSGEVNIVKGLTIPTSYYNSANEDGNILLELNDSYAIINANPTAVYLPDYDHTPNGKVIVIKNISINRLMIQVGVFSCLNIYDKYYISDESKYKYYIPPHGSAEFRYTSNITYNKKPIWILTSEFNKPVEQEEETT